MRILIFSTGADASALIPPDIAPDNECCVSDKTSPGLLYRLIYRLQFSTKPNMTEYSKLTPISGGNEPFQNDRMPSFFAKSRNVFAADPPYFCNLTFTMSNG